MNIIKKLFQPKTPYINGVLPDDRPEKEREKDWLTKEVLTTIAPLNWQDYATWKEQPSIIRMLHDIEVYNQYNVGSCAAQALALLLAIKNYLEDRIFYRVSVKPIYGNRRNKPLPGMYADDIGYIGTHIGSTFEKLYPTPNDTDAHMSDLSDYITAFQSMAKVLRMKNHFWIREVRNIDSFARVLSLGQPLVMTVVFGDGEWGSVPQVKNVIPKYGHMITGLQNSYFIYQGKKAIYVQDSHGENRYIDGRHILTEDWFTKGRVVCGLWFEDMNNLAVFNQEGETVGLPKYQWTRDLTIGSVGKDVRMLQIALSMIKDKDGFLFPLFTQNPTGQFYGITRSAVKRFQLKYNIEPPAGYFGPKTRRKLNSMCK